jgi:hypothetical protein
MPLRPDEQVHPPSALCRAAGWWHLAAAGATALIVEAGLRTMPLPRLARLLGAPLDVSELTAPAGRPELGPGELRRERAALRVLRHWPWGDTCLRRALVVGGRLRRLHPVLRVGVAKMDGRVCAHAWLEIDGASLDPSGAATFLPLRGTEGLRDR